MPLALVFVTACGALSVTVGWMSLVGKLPPNSPLGIRSAYTRKSDANWYAAHRAVAPVLILGGVAVVATGMAFLPFALVGKLSDSLLAAITVILGAMLLAGAGASWFYGARVAR